MEHSNDSKIVRSAVEIHLYVFIASACLMVIELVAGRIVSPYLGSSIYTWTSVIGVVLTGIALGNYIGGVSAERGTAWKGVAFLFVMAGLASIFSFYAYEPIFNIMRDLSLPIQVSSILFAFIGFFPLAFLLSMVTPIVITLSIKSLEKAGSTVGRVYAVSATASIVGTFITGFVLIPFLGVRTIVLSVSAILILTGVWVSRGLLARDMMVKAAVPLLWISFLSAPACDVETAYYCLKLEPVETVYGSGDRLVLDRLTHSFIYDDPRILQYDYEAIYAVATQYIINKIDDEYPISSLNIGGGGYTMPKFLREIYPDSKVDVVEIDPAVTKFNEMRLGLNPEGEITTYNEDARTFFLKEANGNKYDIIFGDAFNDYSVPYHFTTVEFTELVKNTLKPGGIYAVNLIDDVKYGRFLASFYKTLLTSFDYVELSTVGHEQFVAGRNTYVLIASDEPIDADWWSRSASQTLANYVAQPPSLSLEKAQKLVPAPDLADFIQQADGIILTDDYAPVDSMTAPLFR